jgi:hypothetical protein
MGYTPDLAARVRTLQEQYIRDSSRYTKADRRRRHPVGRIADDVAKLGSPLM